MKTNAARLLDTLGIKYELREYEVDPEDLSKELQPLTGFIRGGVTALGGKKEYPVFSDETVELFDIISVSAGVRGTQLLMSPVDYLKVTKCKVGPISRPKV